MIKESHQYQILIVGDDIHGIEYTSKLIHERILSPNLTIAKDLQIIKDKLYPIKFDVIIVISENIKSFTSFTRRIQIPVILISDTLKFSEIHEKITYQISNVFDYLEKSELNSLLLFKSIIYVYEKNKQHNELKKLERRYSDLFHMNPLPMWIYDLEFLRFRQVNDAAIRKYGYTRGEFMKMTLKDIRPPEDVVKLEKAIDLARKHKKLFSNGIYRHKKKDGSVIYVEIVSNIIYINKLKYKIVLANDITESLNYIEAIENQNSKLQEIAYTHSHIIRAPLTNMIGILNLVKDMDLNSPESTELLDHLFTSCNQLDEKITEVVKKSASYPLSHIKNKL